MVITTNKMTQEENVGMYGQTETSSITDVTKSLTMRRRMCGALQRLRFSFMFRTLDIDTVSIPSIEHSVELDRVTCSILDSPYRIIKVGLL